MLLINIDTQTTALYLHALFALLAMWYCSHREYKLSWQAITGQSTGADLVSIAQRRRQWEYAYRFFLGMVILCVWLILLNNFAYHQWVK